MTVERDVRSVQQQLISGDGNGGLASGRASPVDSGQALTASPLPPSRALCIKGTASRSGVTGEKAGQRILVEQPMFLPLATIVQLFN